jgi:RNA polymerase sigma-70 factor (ECF subfamily)
MALQDSVSRHSPPPSQVVLFQVCQGSDELLENVLTYEAPVSENLTDEDILAALTKLPQDFREVLLLADVQEFSYKEIAETLQIPLGTVMSRLSRGRRILRNEVESVAQSMGILKPREAGQGQ